LKKERLLYIDLMRGLLVVFMIETHVSNAFLLSSIKSSNWFSILNFINGLVVPGFLFISGFVFFLTTEKKLNEILKFQKYFWKKIGRIILIFIVGISLHLPYLSLRRLLNEKDQYALNEFFSVDILHCIAIGLFLLLLLPIIIKKRNIFNFSLIVISLVILMVSPILWNINLDETLPLYITNFLRPSEFARFPLFPWLIFIFAGAITSHYFIVSQEKNSIKNFMKIIFLIGIVGAGIGHLFWFDLFTNKIFSIRPNPIFTIQRIAYAILIFSLCYLYLSKKEKISNLILIMSYESLLIYWLHLQIIYRKVFNNKSLENVIGANLNVFESLIVMVIITLVCYLVGKLWSYLKMKYENYTRLGTIILITILILIFLIV
jgi:uncharacterized membrane protein